MDQLRHTTDIHTSVIYYTHSSKITHTYTYMTHTDTYTHHTPHTHTHTHTPHWVRRIDHSVFL